MNTANSVVKAATMYIPAPVAMPTAAVSQTLVAVVSPRTLSPVRNIIPAPRIPIPVTICAAFRPGSPLSNPNIDMSVNRAEPVATRDRVRRPQVFPHVCDRNQSPRRTASPEPGESPSPAHLGSRTEKCSQTVAVVPPVHQALLSETDACVRLFHACSALPR